MYWTPDKCAEARDEWAKQGSAPRAAAELGKRWGCYVSQNGMKDALWRTLGVNAASLKLDTAKFSAANDNADVSVTNGQSPIVDTEKAPPANPRAPAFPARMSAGAANDNVAQPLPKASGPILVISDLHAPMQDPAAFGAILAMMREHRFAELVLLGDAVELESLAWFGGPPTLQMYKDEAQVARGVLRSLLALHDGPVWLVEGNHDARPDQKVEKIAPQLHGSIKDEIGWEELGIRVHGEKAGPMKRGRLLFIHGHQDLPGRQRPINYAKKLGEIYCSAGTSLIFGHVHIDQHHVVTRYGGNGHAYCLGTIESKPHWVKGADQWTRSIAVADPESGNVSVLPIVDGALWFGGVRYAA